MKKLIFNSLLALFCMANVHVMGQSFLQHQWSFVFGENEGGGGTAYDVDIDDNGNIFTVGIYTAAPYITPTQQLNFHGCTDVFLTKHSSNGDLLWARDFGSMTGFEYGNAVKADKAGNVYMTGLFYETIDFDPGIGVAELTSIAGYADIFFAKYDADGNYLWAISMGSTAGSESGHAIITDFDDCVYLLGHFYNTMDANPGVGVAELHSVGEKDIFITKFATNGNLIWAKSLGSIDNDLVYGATVDYEDNIIITGTYAGNIDFDLSSTTHIVNGIGERDIFIAKYDSSGAFIWAKGIGSPSDDESYDIATDQTGNVFITGFFRETVDFNPDPVGEALLVSQGSSDIFVAKYDKNGNFVWAKGFGTDESYEEGWSIAVDTTNNVIIAGVISGSVDFGAGSIVPHYGDKDALIAKFDNNGNTLWAHTIGGEGGDIARAVAVSKEGEIVIAGEIGDGTSDFDLNSGSTSSVYTVTKDNIFITKYDVTDNTAIQENIAANLHVYPNPVSDILTIDIPASKTNANLVIYDINGKAIFRKTANTEQITINTSSWAEGVYFIWIDEVLLKNNTIVVMH